MSHAVAMPSGQMEKRARHGLAHDLPYISPTVTPLLKAPESESPAFSDFVAFVA